MKSHSSWGQYPVSKPSHIHSLVWRCIDSIPIDKKKSFLAFGQGRSYGDCCLNHDNVLLATQKLDRFIHFDENRGILCCESGVLLKDILEFAVPRGWFLAVVPGTQYVSVGGAIANDVHGKNHHKDGTFGSHVIHFELERSDGRRYNCSQEENIDLFCATIGGVGLTGLIRYATLKLRPIENAFVDVESMRFTNIDEFMRLSDDSKEYLYTAAWVDGLASGKKLGRGIFIRANHSKGLLKKEHRKNRVVTIPFNFPGCVINKFFMKIFNNLYYLSHPNSGKNKTINYNSFLFPLDRVHYWNRLYGKRGFLQYQCVVPTQEALIQVFEVIQETHLRPFLVVMKVFSEMESPGLMSFPKKGITVALDFSNSGESLYVLFRQLDEIVEKSGGRVYLAKDARMSGKSFRIFYPEWNNFKKNMDPRFSSNLSRRVEL